MSFLYGRMQKTLEDGLSIATHHFQLLCFSTSQMQTQVRILGQIMARNPAQNLETAKTMTDRTRCTVCEYILAVFCSSHKTPLKQYPVWEVCICCGPTVARNTLQNAVVNQLCCDLVLQSCWFFCEGDGVTIRDVLAFMGDFSKIPNAGKLAARMGMCFSSTLDTTPVLVSSLIMWLMR